MRTEKKKCPLSILGDPHQCLRMQNTGVLLPAALLGKAAFCISSPRAPQRLQINPWFIPNQMLQYIMVGNPECTWDHERQKHFTGRGWQFNSWEEQEPPWNPVWLLISSHLVEEALNSPSTHQHGKKHVLAYGFKGPERCLGKLICTGACSHPPALPPSHDLASQGRTEYLSGDWCGGCGQEKQDSGSLLRLQTEGTVV